MSGEDGRQRFDQRQKELRERGRTLSPGVTMQGDSSPGCCRNVSTFPAASVMLGQVALAPRVERRAKGCVGAKAEADAIAARMSTFRIMLGSSCGVVQVCAIKWASAYERGTPVQVLEGP